jgi:hypothetical protein
MKKFDVTTFKRNGKYQGSYGHDEVSELMPYLFETSKGNNRFVTGFNNRIHPTTPGTLVDLQKVLIELAQEHYNEDTMPRDKNEAKRIKNSAPGFIQGILDCTEFGGTEDTMPLRTLDNTLRAEILAVDIDNKNAILTRKDVLKRLKRTGYEFLIYESMSSTKDHFRCRVVFTLSSPITSNEKFGRLYINLTNAVFGVEVVDLAVSKLNSYLFVGRGNQMRASKYYPGKPISIPTYLKQQGVFS